MSDSGPSDVPSTSHSHRRGFRGRGRGRGSAPFDNANQSSSVDPSSDSAPSDSNFHGSHRGAHHAHPHRGFYRGSYDSNPNNGRGRGRGRGSFASSSVASSQVSDWRASGPRSTAGSESQNDGVDPVVGLQSRTSRNEGLVRQHRPHLVSASSSGFETASNPSRVHGASFVPGYAPFMDIPDIRPSPPVSDLAAIAYPRDSAFFAGFKQQEPPRAAASRGESSRHGKSHGNASSRAPSGKDGASSVASSAVETKKRKARFVEYLPEAELRAGLENQSLFSGKMRVNRKNYHEAYVTVAGQARDILVDGDRARNRAMDGDVVVVKLTGSSKSRGAKQSHRATLSPNVVIESDDEEDVSDDSVSVSEVSEKRSTISAASESAVRHVQHKAAEDSESRLKGEVVGILQVSPFRTVAGTVTLEGKNTGLFHPLDSRFPRAFLFSNRGYGQQVLEAAQKGSDDQLWSSDRLYLARYEKWGVSTFFGSSFLTRSNDC